ncbi:hypothetical protein [Pontibacter sp. SGAir0037]|uniref:hypothetical protein n=1 Tax=Pontibacter sp. SGAir0037 TaxID=2571030 RepID=UPI0010CD6116|nr:hypothetical protein [Pontibacter sp. SGAir0037]QCR23921.1 hypothetical protein C1N53_17240 [Pontibacter sp. SGAir0037]
MQEYFKNNFVSIYYDRTASLGIAEWKGHLRGAEFREAYLLCLDLVDRYALTRWFGDDRLMESIAPEDLDWSINFIIPRLATSSLLRMARLPSYSEGNRSGVETMIAKGHSYDINLILRDFAEKQEALDWLMLPFLAPEVYNALIEEL